MPATIRGSVIDRHNNRYRQDDQEKGWYVAEEVSVPWCAKSAESRRGYWFNRTRGEWQEGYGHILAMFVGSVRESCAMMLQKGISGGKIRCVV